MRRSTPLAFTLFLSAACSRAPRAAEPAEIIPESGHLITHAQIKESGSRTAWEALRRHAPYLALTEDRRGQPASMSRRGQSSFALNNAPMVVVDKVRMVDFRLLRQMPAEEIEVIRILNSMDGTTAYGTNAVGGVIEIRTKIGRYDEDDADSTAVTAKPDKP